jgi:hypothetical protein
VKSAGLSRWDMCIPELARKYKTSDRRPHYLFDLERIVVRYDFSGDEGTEAKDETVDLQPSEALRRNHFLAGNGCLTAASAQEPKSTAAAIG